MFYDAIIKAFMNGETTDTMSAENINFILENIEGLFEECCSCGHSEIALLVYTFSKSKNISLSDECYNDTFVSCCQNGYLEIAKWLISIHENINVRHMGDRALTASVYYGHEDVAEWLCTIVDCYSLSRDEKYGFYITHRK